MLDTGLAATEISFTSVIVAYAKAGRPKEAGKWLQRMLDSNVNPDTIACNAVLLAHANAGDAEGAFHLLRHFETRARDECPNAKPDECSYNTVISACARAGRPAQVEEAP
jgi:pentatricopeptide repeat protein